MTIRMMATERAALEHYLPGLQKELTRHSLLDLEARDSRVIEMFKKSDAPALVVPKEWGGLGASALEATRVQRALGALSPSLGAATTMHHLSIATLIEHSATGTDDEKELLKAVVLARMLLSSGFSEGNPGTSAASAFKPTVTAQAVEGGFKVNGSKQPCSLSASMDLLTASVADEATGRRGVIVIPAASEGITVEPFWETHVLAASQSDTVVLKDVFIPSDMLFWNDVDDPTGQHEKTGYVWFGLLISATYLGAASLLLERMLADPKTSPMLYADAACEIETSMAALEAIARAFDEGDRSDELSARMLFVREGIRHGIKRAASTAVDALGGIAFIKSPEIAYLLAAVQAAGFHPPSRRATADTLHAYHAGTGGVALR
ncbi:acyl-CoA/acyl-ACP dehydrogenase [Streptomyces sp. ZAF1911]|uniref:acyl-CoA dehydrogenase family protein n=1 Tax=Streptomyces sp. ZAF1911 TaxID=2944129 RepID=UPI00237A60EC|nr:acyl-CoA dehydrogenase family protein [Streptomyces sp. ZAF1911]MDD9380343.1 acyl-CoA/acyl-ACP dehydrogenase [Streptomyces sp. ZAF1911]